MKFFLKDSFIGNSLVLMLLKPLLSEVLCCRKSLSLVIWKALVPTNGKMKTPTINQGWLMPSKAVKVIRWPSQSMQWLISNIIQVLWLRCSLSSLSCKANAIMQFQRSTAHLPCHGGLQPKSVVPSCRGLQLISKLSWIQPPDIHSMKVLLAKDKLHDRSPSCQWQQPLVRTCQGPQPRK